jgi:hypothetical protein
MPHIDDETLALCALGEDVLGPAQHVHLEDCTDCARTVQSLARVVDGARDAEHPDMVPPRPEVWTRIHTELGLTEASAVLSPAPASASPTEAEAQAETNADPTGAAEQAHPDELAARRRLRGWLPALAAACTALVLGVAGGVLWERNALQPEETTVASAVLDPLPDWAGVSGEAVLQESADGSRQVVVSVDGPAPEGTYREVWLLTPDASGLVSLGALEGAEGRFAVPEGLDLADYPLVDVSEESFDGDPAHSGDSVVRGELAT